MENSMKKFRVTLLSLAMVAALTACGGAAEEPTTEATEAETTEEKTEADKPASDDTEEATEEATEAAAAEGTTFDSPLCKIVYDDTVWSYVEDDTTNSDTKTWIKMEIPKEDDDGDIVYVFVEAAIGDPYSFREDLYNYGFDEKEYAENDSYDKTNIGGVDFLKYEGSYWGSDAITYIAREEAANESLTVRIVGETDNENVQPLIDNITFNVTDIGNEDGPWYWEGEPYSVEDKSVSLATLFDVQAHQVKFEDPLITHETFDHHIAISGGKLYVLDGDKLGVYAFDGTTATFEQEYTLEGEYEDISAGADGSIWLANFMKPLINWKDGETLASYDDRDIRHVAMSPDCSFGISYFTSPDDCKKISFSSDGTYSLSDISFAGVKIISHINVTDNYIIVTGSNAETDKHCVFLYDFDGNQVQVIAKEGDWGFGSITYVAETSNGLLCMDGNMRKVEFVKTDGSYYGAIEDDALFGSSYPWFCDGCRTEDGGIAVVISEDRPDKSAKEVLVFTINGF